MLITKSPIWVLLDNKYYDVIITYKNDAGELFSDTEKIKSLMKAMDKVTEIFKNREDYLYPYSTVDSIVGVVVKDSDNEIVCEIVKNEFPDLIVHQHTNLIEFYDINKGISKFVNSYDEIEKYLVKNVNEPIILKSSSVSLSLSDIELINSLSPEYRYLFRTSDGALIAAVVEPLFKNDDLHIERDHVILSEKSYLLDDLKELDIIYLPVVKANLRKESL